MNVTHVEHLDVAARAALGRTARRLTPRSSHMGWAPAPDRRDPIALIEQENSGREPDLVPVRHGRMMVSPFTFYRGAAMIMAADLERTSRAHLDVQLCGDAHLSNFGVFASPERTLVFDLNDFDETLPGPFEYDVLRLATSFVVAARNNGFEDDLAGARVAVRAYRRAMAQFAEMGTLAIWYAHLPVEELVAAIRQASPKNRKAAEGAEKILRKARTRDSLAALSKLGELVDGRYRIVNQPPIVIPLRELAMLPMGRGVDVERSVTDEWRAYRSTLPDDIRHLSERFQILDVARKVVGVGSVGTRAFIVLLQGRDATDPLFLQIKEASSSVLENHLPKSRYLHAGERVVQGQRMMQAASDVFLGWTNGIDVTRQFYWRQLRDMKGSVPVEAMVPRGFDLYARMCGWTLARAHARSGDPVALAAYLGRSDSFDRAVVDFATRYADQNERDYEAMLEAVRSGRLVAIEGV